MNSLKGLGFDDDLRLSNFTSVPLTADEIDQVALGAAKVNKAVE